MSGFGIWILTFDIMSGSLTVVVGCMFAGKSEELLRKMKRAEIAGLRPLLVKPALDTRGTAERICSRDGRCMDAISVRSARDILAAAEAYDIIGIDEAQFFDDGIVAVVRTLYTTGKRVIIAGLDTDYRDEPFGSTHFLMAIPEADVVKLRAVCMRCRGEATRTFRKTRNEAKVVIGDADQYEALCYACYINAVSERDRIVARAPALANT